MRLGPERETLLYMLVALYATWFMWSVPLIMCKAGQSSSHDVSSALFGYGGRWVGGFVQMPAAAETYDASFKLPRAARGAGTLAGLGTASSSKTRKRR